MFAKKVSIGYILKNNGSWTGGYADKDKWIYYWIGNFKSGKMVKVSALDQLRYENEKLKCQNIDKDFTINNLENDIDFLYEKVKSLRNELEKKEV